MSQWDLACLCSFKHFVEKHPLEKETVSPQTTVTHDPKLPVLPARLGPSAQPQPQSLSFSFPEVVRRGQQHMTAKFWITIPAQSREAACSLTMIACRWLLSLKACSNLRLSLMRLHLGTLRCKHRTRIGQVTQGFDEECYSFRRCESRLDSASFKVGAGHNFCTFLHSFASGPSNKSTDRCCSWPCFRICVGGSGPALTCLATVPGLLCLVAKNLHLMNLCICAWHVWELVCDFCILLYNIYIYIYSIFAFCYLVPPCSPRGQICPGLLDVEIRRRNSTNGRRFILGEIRLQEAAGMASDISQISQVHLWAHTFPGVTSSISLDSRLPVTFFCWKFVNGCECFVAEAMEGHYSYLFLSVYSAGLFHGRVTG